MSEEPYQIVLTCKHCNNKTAHNIMGCCDILKKFIERDERRNTVYSYKGTIWALLQCKTCQNPILTESEINLDTQTNFNSPSMQTNSSSSYSYQYLRCETEYLKQMEKSISKTLYPTNASVPLPSEDMPPDVANDYMEARSIFEASPRSSAALLRLALQKLCKHLGQPGKNINDDIRALVKAGLSPEIEQVLDTVRIVGNNAVHPGTLNVAESPDIVESIFELINYIIEEMITRPRKRKELYNKLPKKGP